jgi:hypothetical protein
MPGGETMGRRGSSKVVLYGIFLFLLIWPIKLVYDWAHAHGNTEEPIHLLYQVSLFQMELLNSYLNETGKITSTQELDSIKQSLYSAGYTHERLALAVGKDELSPITSINQLMQVVMRLQIGGERPLKTEEIKTLQEASKQFKELYASYEKLISSGGKIVSSQNEKLKKQDADLSELLRKKLLQ